MTGHVVVVAVVAVVGLGLGLGLSLGCGGPPAASEPPAPVAGQATHVDGEAARPGSEPIAPEGAEPIDPREAEQIAAIEYAVNQTGDAVHACYKRAAAADFRLDGVVTLGVEHGAGSAPPRVWVVQDEVGHAGLGACLVEVMQALRWPPVFEPGQQIQIPLSFVSAAAQYTVARAHAPRHEVAPGLAATVMLDEASTGNTAAAMTWLELGAGKKVPLHRHDSAELLYFTDGDGTVFGGRGPRRGKPVAAGTAVYVPPGLPHGFTAGKAGATALQVYAPGGPEQRFEGTEAPGTEPVTGPTRTPLPVVRRLAAAKRLAIAGGEGSLAILFEPESTGDASAYLGVLEARPEMRVPEHDHAEATELLYVLSGEATMTVAGVEETVGPGTAVQIPPGVRHSALVSSGKDLVAIQLYTPAGPEQRFKKLATPQ